MHHLLLLMVKRPEWLPPRMEGLSSTASRLALGQLLKIKKKTIIPICLSTSFNVIYLLLYQAFPEEIKTPSFYVKRGQREG